MIKLKEILNESKFWVREFGDPLPTFNDVMGKHQLKEGFNFRKVRDKLEYEYDWDYVEQEGSDSVRFDFDRNRDSMWIYKNGSIGGNVPKDSGLKRKMKKLGIKESVKEAKFSKDQMEIMRTAFGTLKRMNPSSPTYKKFIKFLDRLPKDELKQLAGANIKFISMLAKNRLRGESINEKLRNVIRQEIKSINEAKARAGDYVKTVYGIGRIKKVRGSVAYIDLPDNKGRGYWPTDIRYLKPSGKKEKGKNLWLESVNESDLGLTYKKGKTVKVTHKKSGKELIIIDKPNVKREYEKIGYFAEGKINEGFEKYHLGGLLDSKLKKRLERAIKLWSGKVDAVGDDYIKFRMSSPDVSRFPALLKKLDHNKNVWIGDKRKNNIWDRRQKINKLEATTSVSVPGYLSPQAFSKSTQNAIDVDDEDDEKNESINEVRWPDNQTSRLLAQAFKDAKVKVQKVWEKGNHEYIIRVRAKDGWTNVKMELNVVSNVITLDTQGGHVRLGELQPGSRGRKLTKNLKMLSKLPSFGVAGFKGLKYKIESINERKLSSHQKKAILIAIEMSGNMTGAVKKIERIKRGLSNDKKVKDALRLANESMAAPFRRRNSRGLGRVMKVGLNESDLGLTYKKGKTVKVTHKKSGKELVIIDKPNVRREYQKIGYFAEGTVNELQMAPFSSSEARQHINQDIKKMSKELGKTSHDIIKMMMDGVKGGKYTAMDISRGIKEGPAKRTHSGELQFIQQLWNKVRDKFRRYSKHGKLS